MKRFASLITSAALAGSLLCVAATAQADSELYLVPISPREFRNCAAGPTPQSGSRACGG